MKKQAHPIWTPPPTTAKGSVLASKGHGTDVEWVNPKVFAPVQSPNIGTSSGGITALTGDVTASGTGSVSATVTALNNVAVNTTGSYVPFSGGILAYSTVLGNQWIGMSNPLGAGAINYWNGNAWTSAAVPTANAQILVWNSASGGSWVPKSVYGDITFTNAGQTTVSALQNTPLNVSGISAPTNGNFLTYSSLIGGGSWQPGGGTAFSGSMMYWNGTAWTSTPAPTSGNVWQWNGSSYSSVTAITTSSSISSGDLTGSYPNPSIAKLQGNTVSASGTVSTGSILAYSGAANAWVPQAASPSVGQVPSWNGTAWAATTPTGGGATNQAWAVTNQGPGASVTTSASTPSGWSISGIIGFSNYLVTVTGTVRTTANTTVSVGLLVNSGGYSPDSGVTVPANASGIATTVVSTHLVNTYGPTTSLTMSGTVYMSSGTGTFYNGNISVIGIS